ncbi:MAG: OB-fold domain-containing protein [Planctomycetes bacterium]|nr:OB-fold domain-containing protein [Planctomycetota bacterium]
MSLPFPFPDTDAPQTRPFWEAAAREELALPRCDACGRLNWYPPERCRACDKDALTWTPVSGRGTLFSWSVVERAWVKAFASHAPYAPGLVALDEDPSIRLVTRIVDCELAALRMEMPMRAVFRPLHFDGVSGEIIAPLFAPEAVKRRTK